MYISAWIKTHRIGMIPRHIFFKYRIVSNVIHWWRNLKERKRIVRSEIDTSWKKLEERKRIARSKIETIHCRLATVVGKASKLWCHVLWSTHHRIHKVYCSYLIKRRNVVGDSRDDIEWEELSLGIFPTYESIVQINNTNVKYLWLACRKSILFSVRVNNIDWHSKQFERTKKFH